MNFHHNDPILRSLNLKQKIQQSNKIERKQYGGFSKPLNHGKFNSGFQRPALNFQLSGQS